MGILGQTEGFLNQLSHLDRRRIYRNPAHNPEHQFGRLYRHRLYLPALHDPAHLRRFGETRQSSLARGRRLTLGCSRLARLLARSLCRCLKHGVVAGCFLVFIPALGEFVIPSLLGGSRTLMIGKVLYRRSSSQTAIGPSPPPWRVILLAHSNHPDRSLSAQRAEAARG